MTKAPASEDCDLVEDDAELREMMQRFLRSPGYEIARAHDGAEAFTFPSERGQRSGARAG